MSSHGSNRALISPHGDTRLAPMISHGHPTPLTTPRLNDPPSVRPPRASIKRHLIAATFTIPTCELVVNHHALVLSSPCPAHQCDLPRRARPATIVRPGPVNLARVPTVPNHLLDLRTIVTSPARDRPHRLQCSPLHPPSRVHQKRSTHLISSRFSPCTSLKDLSPQQLETASLNALW